MDSPAATRKDLQLGRRLFHIAGGLGVAVAYGLFFTHSEAVYILGATACIAYVFDKIRVAYPEIARQVQGLANLFLRAEEKLSESSMIPYVIAVLLTIISFPKPISLIAISTLALADPMASIVGIKFGRHPLAPNRTLEGSLAFFAASLLCAFFVLFRVADVAWPAALGISLMVSLAVTVFETLPVKLDDNLTIPLFVGFTGWILCAVFGVTLK
ncbi:MAG TPA: SEC59/DGK1/VTE5 family protein [bacterium]|nr:SEC59/DGK1/VTE5 family protein [bacterium]